MWNRTRRAFIAGILVLACATTPVYAANTTNTDLPDKAVSFLYVSAAVTPLRSKMDDSSHYVYNQSGFDLRIRSLDSTGGNHTRGGYAVVPSGTKRRIVNYIYETGYSSCKLQITSAKSGVSGTVSGKWSPDCAGSYPAAN